MTIGAELLECSHESVVEGFGNACSTNGTFSNLISGISGALLGRPVVGTVVLVVLGLISTEDIAVLFAAVVVALLDPTVLFVVVLKGVVALVEFKALP